MPSLQPPSGDPSSAANLTEFTVTHFEFVYFVDFTRRELRGAVDIHVQRLPERAGSAELVLDVHHLHIAAVHALDTPDAASGSKLAYHVKPFAAFGSALHVDVARLAHAFVLRVWLRTGDGPALCWLDPPQTAGKVHPFLFTQGQACLNRSLLPCMDTPAVRSSWRGRLLVPAPFRAVMSAVMSDADATGVPADAAASEWHRYLSLPAGCESGVEFAPVQLGECRVFTAAMARGVPVYLTALAVGDIASASIGPRSRVWTEPAQLERAVHEFGHRNVTEEYVSTGERLFGPYQWGRYDVVVMPPSFPFGGMENPNATFVTPALLAGDQSLTDVIAHEIAHSWTGNLVTNSSWTQFFLNEGFTMYLQRRITQAVDGVAVTALETVAGRALLRRAMIDYADKPELTRLVVPLGDGIDPDETYTETPYEKGFAFVSYLRACVGSHEAFDAWLKTYTSRFSFESIAAVDMLDSFFAAFPQFQGDWTPERWLKEEAEEAASYWDNAVPVPEVDALEKFGELPPLPDVIQDAMGRRGLAYRPGYEFMRWFHAPGWPVYYPSLAAAEALSRPAEALATAWLSRTALPLDAAAFAAWPTIQKLHFLDSVLAQADKDAAACSIGAGVVTHELLQRLDEAYGFGTNGNAEIRLRWSQIVVIAVWEPGFSSVTAFLDSTGKLKYVTPVFRALVGSRGTVGRELAKALWARLQPSLHTAVRSRVGGVMEALA